MDSPVGTNKYFPRPALLRLFRYVDGPTIVSSCRLVCSTWKEAAESQSLWRTKMLCERKDQVPPDVSDWNHPWYIWYALYMGIFNRNLFVFDEEIPEDLVTASRDAPITGNIRVAHINSNTGGFAPIPQELIDDRETKSFLCAFGDCGINHSIDLYAHGFSREIMEVLPPIHISEWFSVRSGFIAVYHIGIKLLNSDWECDTRSQYSYQRQIGQQEWHKVCHTFRNYRPDVRYVVFDHGINTRLPYFVRLYSYFQFGVAASKIAGTKLCVGMPPSSPSTEHKPD